MYYLIYLKRLRRGTKNLSHDSWPPERNFNSAHKQEFSSLGYFVPTSYTSVRRLYILE